VLLLPLRRSYPGEFLAWLLERGIQPHIPAIDRRHHTGGHFTRKQFRYAPEENTYYCPHGEPLRYGGLSRGTQSYACCGAAGHCRDCPPKERCTPGATRKLSVRWREAAREAVRTLASIPAYERFRRARYRIEALFAKLKQRRRLDRVRLRRLWTVAKQLLLAATAQNPKRLMKSLVHEHAVVALSTA